MRVIPINIFIENVEQLLSEGNSVELRCFGRSMQPYLHGDGREVIVASPFSPDELIPGAIVLFRYKGRHICHRIIRREGEQLLIQGDGVIGNREKVSTSDVIGIVRTIVRRNKKPVSTQTKAAQWYWRCWFRLSPVRRYLLYAYRLWIRIFVFFVYLRHLLVNVNTKFYDTNNYKRGNRLGEKFSSTSRFGINSR